MPGGWLAKATVSTPPATAGLRLAMVRVNSMPSASRRCSSSRASSCWALWTGVMVTARVAGTVAVSSRSWPTTSMPTAFTSNSGPRRGRNTVPPTRVRARSR